MRLSACFETPSGASGALRLRYPPEVESARRILESTWDEHGVDTKALSVELDGTVLEVADRATRSDLTTTLPVLIGGSRTDELSLGELISEGGMGRVHVGTQLSMEREVAVKRLRPGLGKAATAQLLKEARVIGALQHPAIVPVHGLGVDADGNPLIVMKHLTGDTWAAKLADGAADPKSLDVHLSILEQVANAVAFAHSRGVLHRDIKPENVMLGDFAAVYLVDWGLALDLGDANVNGLPTRDQVQGIAGTIQYMAPEQALGSGSDLGTPTDVFQLGATLLHILTGAPPHALPSKSGADDLTNLFYGIFTFRPPPLPQWVPEELARICTTALAAEPERRYDDAVAFRDALAEFRAHHDSMLATERAQRRVQQAAEAQTPDGVGTLLAEARFGFEQALRTWPENQTARRGLDETLVQMVERELELGRPDAAQVLLARLEGSHPDLDTRMAQLRSDITARRRRVDALEAAARESDLSQAASSRRFAGIAFAVLFFVTNSTMAWLERAGVWEMDHLKFLVGTTIVASVFGLPTFAMRKRLFPNKATWRLVSTLAFMLLGQVVAFCAMWAYGLALQPTLIVTLFPLAMAISIKTYLLEKRVFWTTFAVLAVAVIGIVYPPATLEMVGLAYAVYFITGAMLKWDENSTAPLLLEDLRRSEIPKER